MSKENKPSISEKIAKLDELLGWFDSDNFELEEALAKFSEAKALADDIERSLNDMKNKITVVSEQFNREA